MRGLPETFDMAKRVGLILYVPLESALAIPFDDIFQSFKDDHSKLEKELSKYRSGCKNEWSLDKYRLGLPRKTSRTSFSKYVRVAHGMNLVVLEDKNKCRPNWLTFVVNIISRISKKTPKLSFFEIPFGLKLFFTNNLLITDNMFIIPILKALKQTEVSSDAGFLSRTFLMKCAQELAEFFSSVLSREPLELTESQLFYKRLTFFEKNYFLIENGRAPTRGFLHMIEPRVHWLIDLFLVDFHLFCEKGEIRPANFLSQFLRDPFGAASKEEEVMSGYFDYVNSLALPSELRKAKGLETLKDVTELAVKELKEYYPQLIPVESVILLAQVLGSIVTHHFVSGDKISDQLKQNYIISRDWGPTKGFLEVGHTRK